MEPLAQFYANESMREQVKAFQLQQLRELAADTALEGEDTSGIRLANKAIVDSFDKMQAMYGKVEEEKPYDPR